MTDQPPNLERDLTNAYDRVMRHGALLYVERIALNPLTPLSLLGPLTDDDGAQDAVMWWSHGPSSWLVARGCVEDCLVRYGDRFTHSADALKNWRRKLVNPDDARLLMMVGGFAFATQHDSWEAYQSPWRAFGNLRMWLPECAITVDDAGACVAVLCYWLKPGESIEEWTRRSAYHKGKLADWLEHRHAPTSPQVFIHPARSCHPESQWADLVNETASMLAEDGPLDKVVLARALRATSDQGLAVEPVVRALYQKFTSCRVFSMRPPGSASWFVGATPECLAQVKGDCVYVDALAGTAPPDVDEDEFLSREKDRVEHQLVIDAIEDVLSPIATLDMPDVPEVDRLANVAHLRTPIRATLNDPTIDALHVAQLLHPTPAVCGLPRQDAKLFIHDREGLDRGWYTGAIGWMTLDGDGEWDVAIRCALIHGDEALVYVGAGIVSASQGDAEVEETRLKAQAILAALGVESSDEKGGAA